VEKGLTGPVLRTFLTMAAVDYVSNPESFT